MVIKVADFLIQAIARVMHRCKSQGPEELKDVTDWYDCLVDLIDTEVSRVGYEGMKEQFFRHYL